MAGSEFPVVGFDEGNRKSSFCVYCKLREYREAPVAQLVEHVLGKDEVSGSIPLVGSIILEWPDGLVKVELKKRIN